MSGNTEVQKAQFWTNDDVEDLIIELSTALDMMSPYYSQCNGGRAGYDLLARLEKKRDEVGPFFAAIEKPVSCAICQKEFGKSAKKNKHLNAEQQYSSAMCHMVEAHNMTDYDAKKAAIIPRSIVNQEFKHRREFLEGVNIKFFAA